MKNLHTIPTTLDGVVLLDPPRLSDTRGMFRPVFAQRLHANAGYDHQWAEMNLSHTKQGCVRGLHFQQPNSQAKLISVVDGTIFDVVVDLRPDSATFGKWESFTLSASDTAHPSQIYIPEGYAHGLATPQGPATIAYLVSRPWDPDNEYALLWNDPELAIAWPINDPELSPRDRAGTTLAELKNTLKPGG